MAQNAREAALAVLTACRKAEAWADGALKGAVSGLEAREAALASRITYGVLQNRALLDHYLKPFLKGKDIEPVIADILRIGAYQILLLDKIPPSAAVNCAVDMAKSHHRTRAAGMVNAVLRNMTREKERLPLPPSLSVQYSHPQWLVERFGELVGETELGACLAANNGAVPTTIQRNPLACTKEELLKELSGLTVTPHPWMEDCYEVSGTGDLEKLPAFQKGYFLVQDAAAALPPVLAGCQKGQRVMDICAAPGGKSFGAAIAMENEGEVFSFDIHAGKLRQVEEGAKRLHITCIHTQKADGRVFLEEFAGSADVVLCDVPCSGLGIIRKKPDIRYKDPKPLSGLPPIQLAILKNAARYVKKGGVLLYSTCTVLPEENRQVVDAFLKETDGFVMEPFSLPVGETAGDMTFWPHRHHTDGFYVCKLRKQDD